MKISIIIIFIDSSDSIDLVRKFLHQNPACAIFLNLTTYLVHTCLHLNILTVFPLNTCSNEFNNELSLSRTVGFSVGSIHLSGLACNARVKLLYIVDDVQDKWDAIKQYWKLDDTQFLCSSDADKVFQDPR